MRPDLDDAGLRRYLLGLLPEAEAEALEEAYLGRPEVWERVRAAEDDLLYDYASDRLGPSEKAAFESRYLASPFLRERVMAARALRLAAVAARVRPARVVAARPTRWVGPVALAAGVLLALAVFWSWPTRPPRVASVSPTPAAPSATPQPPPSAPMGGLPTPASPGPQREPPARPLVLALSPMLLRGEERLVELRIPPGTDTVVLELEGDPAVLPPSTAAFEAAVDTVEGEPVWRGEARRVTAGSRPSQLTSARVPAAKLVAGDYLLTLSTRGNTESTLYRYFFRVGR